MLPKRPRKVQRVYLDHAAATPLDAEVFAAMRPWLIRNFANPSALYASAVVAREAIEDARKSISGALATRIDSIIFTGSGTESNNLAIFGVARLSGAPTTPDPSSGRRGRFRGHIVTTAIEHHAVLNPIRHLEKEGWEVTYLPVNKYGALRTEQVKSALRPETILVSIMFANNEVGTIEPIAEIGREILKWRNAHQTPYPYFHTDACQAAGYLDLRVDRLHVDLMSLNGSKIYGPKGVGILYKRRGVELSPIICGGGQEFGLRSGTENVAGIVGFAKALELLSRYQDNEIPRVEKLRNYFWEKIQMMIEDVMLNGPLLGKAGRQDTRAGWVVDRLPNNLNITFQGVDAEALILYLDEYGIQCSSGSACTADSDEISHVFLACGLSEEQAKSCIRFTLGKKTVKRDIDYAMKYLPQIVEELRRVQSL